MENQHRKIAGYRDLLPSELDLINRIKDLGNNMIESLLADTGAHINLQRRLAHNDDVPQARGAEQQRLDAAQPERWLAMARTDFQTALMKLVRAVAQPERF